MPEAAWGRFAGRGRPDQPNLIIVSNRLPFTVAKRQGELRFQPSVGGLATGLASVAAARPSTWVGWPGIGSDRIRGQEDELRLRLAERGCHPVLITERSLETFYSGFCNNTLWPLFHYFVQDAEFSEAAHRAYRRVNDAFCEAVAEVARPGDRVWIHDYHLMLLPKLVRERMPKVEIGVFIHIPFPSFEVFRSLPWREELLEGMLGADLIGFHTHDYVQHFLNSVRYLVGYEPSMSEVPVGTRTVKVDAFPMGIDYQRFARAADSRSVARQLATMKRKVGDRRMILSVDRLDYTKGIPERLEAYDLFLERNPDLHEKVTLVMLAVPSRTRVERYARLKRRVDEIIGRINGKYGNMGWMPVRYMYRSVPFENLVALYRAADVALVTPLRDGMNLIAKEYVAAKGSGDGALVLSEMAGAAGELSGALLVNPNSTEDMARALRQALDMGEAERGARSRAMRSRLSRHTVTRWGEHFLDSLDRAGRQQAELALKRLTPAKCEDIVRDFRASRRRLLLLDYDGTLRSFTERPEQAKPDARLLRLLRDVAAIPGTQAVLVSGRDRSDLESWFGGSPLGLIAEHGAWIREAGGEWETTDPISPEWKDAVRPILEIYVDRAAGSFIEEKAFSVVWHYRSADPEIGALRARELREHLHFFVDHMGLEILEGHKVVEIKTAGVHKGRGALHWLGKFAWDFVLAAGDDVTDEQLFASLPASAVSIKVGAQRSRATYNAASIQDIRRLLRELTRGHC